MERAYQPYLFAIDDRSNFLAILPPETHLATFDWLFPRSAMRPDDIRVWRYAHAVLLANAGQTEKARTELEDLLRDLNAEKVDGRSSIRRVACWPSCHRR